MSLALRNSDFNLDELDAGQLPSMQPGASELIESLSGDDLEYDEMIEVVERFPSIVGRLISLANSAWSSPVSSIDSLETACSRLGFNVVRNTSIALAVARPFDPTRCPRFESGYFWCSAMLVAEAAAALVSASSLAEPIEPASARTAGLLHNLGLLWLVDRVPEDVSLAFEAVDRGDAVSLGEALPATLGFDHAHAGGRLGQLWELPPSLVAAMAFHRTAEYQGDYDNLVASVGLAASLVSAVLLEDECPVKEPRAEKLRIAESELHRVFDKASGDLPRVRELAEMLFKV